MISILAPAKGATIHNLSQVNPVGNFNPRSREGSDVSDVLKAVWVTDFNPRSREGSDRCIAVRCSNLSISILAPAKGATLTFTDID